MDNTKSVGQRPPPQYVHPQQNAVRGQYLPNMAMPSQYMPPKEMVPANVPYVSRNGAIYPATAMPPGPSMYQPTSKYPNQTRQQPIVIMPGGGSFSNPGQFVPQPGNVSTRKEMVPSGGSTVKQVGNNKEQTPFQKLRKVAEDISTFVDDVVKFKGKKGRLLLWTWKYVVFVLFVFLFFLHFLQFADQLDLRGNDDPCIISVWQNTK